MRKSFSAIRNLLKEDTYLVTILFIVSILILSPWGNYALADDYYYLTQIKAFSLGELTRSALIGPTFLAQNFLSISWSAIFGLTYQSLRILTIIISIFCVLIVGRIADELHLERRLKVLFLFLFAFNPFFYSCSLNLMTENYFLFFVLTSIYYFLLYIRTERKPYLLASSLLGGMSIMVRQFGFALMVSYAVFYIFTKRKIRYKDLVTLLLPFLVIGGIAISWPKYSSGIEPKSTNIFLFFGSFKDTILKVFDIKILTYVGYFLFPIILSYVKGVKKKTLLILLTLSFPLSYLLYSNNIFSIGNLFYLEGLQARLRVNIRNSLFNNIPFKILLSYFISFSILVLIEKTMGVLLSTKSKYKKLNKDDLSSKHFLLFSIISLTFYSIGIVAEAYFDRYFINFFIFITFTGVLSLKIFNVRVSSISILSCLLISTITYFIVFDYHSENKLKWDLANKVHQNYRVLRKDIFIDQLYASTIQMEDSNNYKGFEPVRPQEYYPTCFVQEYSRQNENNILYKLITYTQNKPFTQKYLKYRGIEIDTWNKSKSNNYDSNDYLLYNEEYVTPVYNLIGKRMYVRAFCTQSSGIEMMVPETGLEPASP